MEDFRQVYQAPETQWAPNSNEPVVELASPWKRIGAFLINQILSVLVAIPMYVSMWPLLISTLDNQMPSGIDEDAISSMMGGVGISAILGLILLVLQIVFMVKDGQSIGKKLLKIKVVTLNGENPGFVGYVLLREFVFWLLVSLVGIIPLLGLLAQLGVYIALLVMIFLEQNNRSTLQDMLAKTLVVNA